MLWISWKKFQLFVLNIYVDCYSSLFTCSNFYYQKIYYCESKKKKKFHNSYSFPKIYFSLPKKSQSDLDSLSLPCSSSRLECSSKGRIDGVVDGKIRLSCHFYIAFTFLLVPSPRASRANTRHARIPRGGTLSTNAYFSDNRFVLVTTSRKTHCVAQSWLETQYLSGHYDPTSVFAD